MRTRLDLRLRERQVSPVSESVSKTKSQAGESQPEPVPSRTIGLTIMCLMIAFVAVWMSLQSRELEGDAATMPAAIGTQTGFLDYAQYLPDETLMGFELIPAGPFTMGSNPALDRLAYENERWSSTRRQGLVELEDYYIGRYEVTVAQFRAFQLEQPDLANAPIENAASDLPVTNVTWPEALAYARWLQAKLLDSSATPDALRNFLNAGGQVTLPSEAEWEKAARGSDGRIFPWGNQPSTEFANFGSDGPLPIGSKRCVECAYGLEDMSGNVWELTRSPLQPYPYDDSDDAENLTADALWVMRGGSYADGVGNVRSAVRGGVDPSVRNSTIGFRLAISRP